MQARDPRRPILAALTTPAALLLAAAGICPTVQAAPAAVPGLLVFNEVRADDAGSDDAEFVELLGAVGLVLEGWQLEHYNGAASGDGPVFSLQLSGTVAAASGARAADGTALGTVLVGAPTVSGIAFELPGGLQNGPDGLVLRAPDGTVVDAVAWGGVGDLPLDDPGGAVAGRLRVLPDDDSSDASLQMGTDFGGAWTLAPATPGSINPGQGLEPIGGLPAVAPVPLPAPVALFASALPVLAGRIRRRIGGR